MKFGTIIIDPPWPYRAVEKAENRQGYASNEYALLSVDDLAALPIGEVADDPCVLLLWATWPFLPDALRLMTAWGFEFKTALPWVKATEVVPGTEVAFKPKYGVGYWMRGCSEPILLGLRGKGSVRTPWMGLLCQGANHSRKPDTLYELAESFPGPYLEIFARRERARWVGVGNESPDFPGDVRESLALIASV